MLPVYLILKKTKTELDGSRHVSEQRCPGSERRWLKTLDLYLGDLYLWFVRIESTLQITEASCRVPLSSLSRTWIAGISAETNSLIGISGFLQLKYRLLHPKIHLFLLSKKYFFWRKVSTKKCLIHLERQEHWLAHLAGAAWAIWRVAHGTSILCEGHPEECLFIFSGKIFSGSNYPKSTQFNSENRSTACRCSLGDMKRSAVKAISEAFLVEILHRPPRKLFIFMI